MDRPSILFVSQTSQIEQPYLDPSVRYRCYNFAEDIQTLGGIADVVSFQRFQMEMIDCYDYFIFCRPWNGNNKLSTILELLNKKNKLYHADYDDLIFAVEFALESSIYLNRVCTETETIKIFEENYEVFRLFDYYTTSTEPLAKEISRLNPKSKVTVVPNGLSRLLLASFGLLHQNHSRKINNWPIRVISYLSGTKSHNLDFEYVKDVLIAFLKRHRDFYLMIAGPLDIDERQFPRDSLFRKEVMPYRQFFESASRAYLNLAPLKLNNKFNECKSSLKFFESGIWGVPTIASSIGDYKRFSDSKGLKLVNSLNEWEECLEMLVDTKEYEKATRGLQEYCMKNCLSSSSTDKLLYLVNHRRKEIQ
jgi:hypothetical protein